MNDVMKLLDNGWAVVLFRDGLGSYSALAYPADASADDALDAWQAHEPPEGMEPARWIFDGPNRCCGVGMTPEEALAAVTEKVLFGRLPPLPEKKGNDR